MTEFVGLDFEMSLHHLPYQPSSSSSSSSSMLSSDSKLPDTLIHMVFDCILNIIAYMQRHPTKCHSLINYEESLGLKRESKESFSLSPWLDETSPLYIQLPPHIHQHLLSDKTSSMHSILQPHQLDTQTYDLQTPSLASLLPILSWKDMCELLERDEDNMYDDLSSEVCIYTLSLFSFFFFFSFF